MRKSNNLINHILKGKNSNMNTLHNIPYNLLAEKYNDTMESGAFIYDNERAEAILNELEVASFCEIREVTISQICSNSEEQCKNKTYFIIKFGNESYPPKEIVGCTACLNWCRSE